MLCAYHCSCTLDIEKRSQLILNEELYLVRQNEEQAMQQVLGDLENMWACARLHHDPDRELASVEAIC